MYKNLAVLNGALLAVMVFYNGMLSNLAGPYISTLIYHTVGLILVIALSILSKNKLSNLKSLPFAYFMPGILSVVTILFNNISIPHIGLTLAIGVTLFGQLVMSCIVEHLGLFGMPVNRFTREKALGFSIILLGILFMTIM